MRKTFSASLLSCKTFLIVLTFQLGLFPFLISDLKAQVYNGNLTLNSQADVDAFNYTSVTGILFISNVSSNITNLDHLSTLTSVGTNLLIDRQGHLQNLNGLSNLQSVHGLLAISGCPLITNLDGLSGLQSIHDLEIGSSLVGETGNKSLKNIDGLSNLLSTSCKSIQIENNDSLTSINALINFSSFPSNVVIKGNDLLSDISGLSNLTEVDGNFTISGKSLTNLNALSNLTKVGHTLGVGGFNLTDISGLSNLTSIGDLSISAAESNLDAFSNISSIFFIELLLNPNLTNTDGLLGITQAKGGVFIDNNDALTNLHGLSNITSISGRLHIQGNLVLPNLNDLSNLNSVGFDITIDDNPALTDFCGLYNLFNTGTISGKVEVFRNGANTVSITPVQQLIIFADQGLCSAVINNATIGTPTVNGCLVPITTTHTDYPAGNVFPVGTTNITWTATDAAGNTATATRTILVVDQQPPTISCPANITVSCASDIPAVNINSVTASDNCSAIVTHVSDDTTNKSCANRFTLTRTYRATDPAGHTADCSQVITVNDNIPPQITGLTVSQQILAPPNHKMVDVTLDYSIIDNCVSTPNFSLTVSSNEPVNGTADGDTDPDWVIIDGHHIQLRAERAANGSGRIYTITVTANDGCNAPVSATTQVRVTHNITNPQSGHPFIVGSTVNFNGEFWDKPTNKHTGKWLIDDNTSVKGIVTEPTATKNGKVTGSYKFNTAGVYKLQMNTIDQNNVTTYANTNGDIEEIVVVYDPNGGYTYGGGWFNSQAGSLTSDPTAEGKASYGFTVNYFKNSTYPKGETQFEFKVGNFEFDALNFDYLVINGARAQFRGTGKITGDQSGYGFMMTVIDGDLDGSGIDKIRMKIYNKNTGAVIYDNQMGANDAADPSTGVGSNSSITIYSAPNALTTSMEVSGEIKETIPKSLQVTGYPNPYDKQLSLSIVSPVSGIATIQFFSVNGAKIYQTRKYLVGNTTIIIPYTGRFVAGTVLYSVNIDKYRASGFVIHPN